MALTDRASILREPCAKCNNPVFIAERLNVGKLLFHRTCFRCARCSNQLTLANYYETENNAYCCETCPDEEVVDQSVLSRSLSDEEKSANLKNDDYSTRFLSPLKNISCDEFASARSNFVQSQLDEWESHSGTDEPPELPSTKPPDLKNIDEDRKSLNFYESDNEDKCSDSNFPLNEQKQTVYASVNSVSDKAASIKLDSVTKDESSVVSETPDSVVVIEDSIITISDSNDSARQYPDELNPFGDDDNEDEDQSKAIQGSISPPFSAITKKDDYDPNLNPFGSEDDENDEKEKAPSPKPRLRKKIHPLPEDWEIPGSPIRIPRISVNPHESENDVPKEQSPIVQKKVIPAPRTFLVAKEDQEWYLKYVVCFILNAVSI